MAVLVVLVPLGLLAPGEAFAEWGANELDSIVGFAPAGLKSMEGLYNAPLAGYGLPGATGFTSLSLGYILSAVVGISVVGLSLFAWYRVRSKDVSPNDS